LNIALLTLPFVCFHTEFRIIQDDILVKT